MSVYTDLTGHSARITFSKPPVNALDKLTLQELTDHIRAAGEHPDIKVIVLQSEGKTFCAGADFSELISLEDHDEAVDFFMGFGRVINAMRKAPKPVIVRVQGKAVGGGVGIVAAADIAFSIADAALKLSELSIGIGPYVIAPAIIRKSGKAFFQEMAFQPWRWFSAFDAQKHGLIASVSENKKTMDESIGRFVAAYEKTDAEAVARLKREVWKDAENWDALLREQAEKSAALLLREPVKNLLREMKNK